AGGLFRIDGYIEVTQGHRKTISGCFQICFLPGPTTKESGVPLGHLKPPQCASFSFGKESLCDFFYRKVEANFLQIDADPVLVHEGVRNHFARVRQVELQTRAAEIRS